MSYGFLGITFVVSLMRLLVDATDILDLLVLLVDSKTQGPIPDQIALNRLPGADDESAIILAVVNGTRLEGFLYIVFGADLRLFLKRSGDIIHGFLLARGADIAGLADRARGATPQECNAAE